MHGERAGEVRFLGAALQYRAAEAGSGKVAGQDQAGRTRPHNKHLGDRIHQTSSLAFAADHKTRYGDQVTWIAPIIGQPTQDRRWGSCSVGCSCRCVRGTSHLADRSSDLKSATAPKYPYE